MPLERILESLRFWWRNLGPLLLVTAPFAVGGELLQWWLGPALEEVDDEQIRVNTVGALALLALRPFLEGAVIGQLAAIQAGRPRGLGACLMFALRMAPALVPVYLLVISLSYAGLLLFLLPGIWIYSRLCLAPFIATLEAQPPLEALRSSVERTRGTQQWIIFAAVALAGTGLLLMLVITGTLLQQLLGENHASTMLLAILTTLGGALISVLAFRFHLLSAGHADTE